MTKLTLHREFIPDDEGQVIADMVHQTVKAMKPIDKCLRRAQHPKATMCVKAEFTVLRDLPKQLQYGVLAEPGATFEAIMRFSNSLSDPDSNGGFASDAVGTGRGMAIKLIDRQSSNATTVSNIQDFLLLNHPVFPFPDPQAYLSTMTLKGLPLVGNLIAGAQLALLERDELAVLTAIRNKQIASPLEAKYWSVTPYWLGSSDGSVGQAVKYVVTHHQHSMEVPRDSSHFSQNYLGDAGYEFLTTNEALFTFKVQVQTDAESMPIENASIRWDEDTSDPIPVAQLRIPIQRRDTNFEDEVESMQFNPWHALKEHRPMGGLNRLRKAVYEASSQSRHGKCPV